MSEALSRLEAALSAMERLIQDNHPVHPRPYVQGLAATAREVVNELNQEEQ